MSNKGRCVKVKVAIDNRATEKTGMGTYSRILLSMIPQEGRSVDVAAYEDFLEVNRNSFLNQYVNGLKRVIRDQFIIAKWQKANDIDVFHYPRNTGTVLLNSCKVITTIHDVIPHALPKYYLRSIIDKIYYEIMIRIAIWRSDKIITISEFSKQELIKHYNIPKEKIVVTPLACNDAYKPCEQESVNLIRIKYKLDRPYIMTIGGSEYRKNVQTVIKAYLGELEQSYDLIVIGGAWRNLDLPKEYKNHASIKFLKGIPDEDLVNLYNGADVFVFASFYEGFGLPLLEAMGCGTPVIAANASCLPEVSGDAAQYFEPFDSLELRNLLKKVLSDDNLRDDMINKGYERRKLYSWSKTAEKTYAVYKDVFENR